MGGMYERIIILSVFVGWQGWRYLETVLMPAPPLVPITMTAAMCTYIMLCVLALQRIGLAVRILSAILLLVGSVQLVVAAYRGMGEASAFIGMLSLLGAWRLRVGLRNEEQEQKDA
ncbi:hypothetical protein Desaf_0515 [Desulfocurvibacter africanus subsp. africanus str. Walvis Bay]|uniref:Uncharacterized protein n=2 Tax=Desulfocurvibacter africanus TaxID=873 RepID=F3YVR0_DESAF|nr:hypothetical protein Desaf_0515 [Desulfocurvibacter africanus subsp. africanus str. Walvis Bay]